MNDRRDISLSCAALATRPDPSMTGAMPSGGARFALLAAARDAFGTRLRATAPRGQGLPTFGPRERWLFRLSCAAAVAGLGARVTGALTI